MPHVRSFQRGFTLTELAVVVAIVALILGGIVMTMGTVANAREIEQTQQQLNQAREALVGFAIRYGRLPCPATDGSNDVVGAVTTPSGGLESFCTTPGAGVCGANVTDVQAHGQCSNPDGFVPAATLGIGPTDAQGFLLDAWQGRRDPRGFVRAEGRGAPAPHRTPAAQPRATADRRGPIPCGRHRRFRLSSRRHGRRSSSRGAARRGHTHDRVRRESAHLGDRAGAFAPAPRAPSC